MINNDPLRPFGAVPSARQLDHLRMGKKVFFHFGMNTFSGTEWGNGTEHEKLFAPTALNVRQWLRVARDAGFKLAIITAKHHDGFCLWPSAYTEHSVKNSPYKEGKGDIVREFTDACREFGLRAGVYLSPWDRHSSYWGKPEYSDFYAKQLTELMTNYGRIDEVWWDGAGSADAVYRWDKWAHIIGKYQPHACIFGSFGATPFVEMRWVGNEGGFAAETHYSSIDNDSMFKEDTTALNRGVYGAERFIPSEVDTSIRPGWFYHSEQDAQVKSVEELNNLWFRSIGRNSVMLLNFPPDKCGLVADTDAQNAKESAKQIDEMLAVNLLSDATVTADSTFDGHTVAYAVENKRESVAEKFYVSNRNTAIIDILLPTPAEMNVLALGEEITLGERITSFRLESLDGDEPHILWDGASVGFYRAVIFKKSVYRHLRLTLTGKDAVPTLRTLALHLFCGNTVNPAYARTVNLLESKTASVEMAPDRKSAVLAFGGVYPFRNIYFGTKGMSGVRIYAFDGSKYTLVLTDIAKSEQAEFHLSEPLEGSYQIRIECDMGFADDPDFYVG